MGFFDIIKMILIAACAGVTEWLPVSNSAHITVLGHYLGFPDWNASAVFREQFVGAATFGALMAAVLLFLPKNLPLYRDWKGNVKAAGERTRIFTVIGLSWIPNLVIGLIFGSDFSAFTYASDSLRTLRMTMVLMIAGGLIVWFAEIRNRATLPLYDRPEDVPFRFWLLIGLVQTVAFLPGCSRFGIAILLAVSLGIGRRTAVTVAILSGMPSLIVNGLLPLVIHGIQPDRWMISELITAAIVSFLVSFAVVRAIVSYLSKTSLTRFAKYRIAFGILLYLFCIL